MIIEFRSIGLDFKAHFRYYEPCEFTGELGELILEKLYLTDDTDVTFLLDSTVIDQLYEDAYDAAASFKHEEAACQADRIFDQRREEALM